MFTSEFAVVMLSSMFAQNPTADVGFIEDFALAKDREAAIRQLIPGTEDFYYYSCLHFLNTQQYEKAERLWPIWHERFGQTQRLNEIQTRHALLTYEKDPKRSLEYLRRKLGLTFNHQKENLDAPPNLPTELDQNLISRSALLERALRANAGVDGFEDSALDWLAETNLDNDRRRALLQRLARPDVPGLPRLIVADLQAPNSPGFGAFEIHKQLTAAQLEEVARLQPAVLNQSTYVHARLIRLQPSADEPWRRDPRMTQAYLDRLLNFTRTLGPVHNPLKAHALYHRLAFDRHVGQPNKERFLEYLRLPRPVGYVTRRLLEQPDSRRFPALLDGNFAAWTLLPPVGNDEPLVREFLKRFLVDAASTAEFDPYIDDQYLKQAFAETKIENGLGDPEQWASLLTPEQFRELRERIDIDFAATNLTEFAAEDAVTLDLFVKNVPTLIVKVFEINTLNWHRQKKTEISTDINLDGLVANEEMTFTYNDSPLRRVSRRFEFPKLNRAGVFVIDFIGGGKSSRALVRKGRIRPIVTTGAAGQVFRLFDEKNRKIDDGFVWLDGKEYKAGKEGEIVVPFSTAPGNKPVVVGRGDFSSLDAFQHLSENYRLTAAFHVDRESLLARRTAQLLIRPRLEISGAPTSIKLLEDVRLQIASVDHSGTPSLQEIPDAKLFEDRETTHEIRTPPRLASLTVTLRAKVKSLTTGRPIDVSASQTFALNGIDKTDKIEDLHLARFGSDWALELLGRSGESKSDRAVRVTVKHRDFREPVQAMLKTDGKGRILLGSLAEIAQVSVMGPEGTSKTWPLPMDQHSFRQAVHGRAGETVSLPYTGTAAQPRRSEFALFELRGEAIVADRFENLAIANGMVELKGLPAGDFDLWFKESNRRIRVRMVEGETVDGWILGKRRYMQSPALAPLQIESMAMNENGLVLQLRHATKFARVHVFATRYVPAFSPFGNLSQVRDAELLGSIPAFADALYLTGRNIGDEYRYVIDRKYQTKYPGNMLERPSLLLNPWAIRSTETTEQTAAWGDQFAKKAAPPREAAPAPAHEPESSEAGGDFANLDFLADASAVALNLVPDENGRVVVPADQLGPHAMVHAVAVDPLNTTARSIYTPEKEAKALDLRLAAGLDPAGHFGQQKKITLLQPGQPLRIADLASSRFEIYDSVGKLYSLFANISKDAKLAEFAFIAQWPKLKPEEKRSLYSKHACHELSFFLFCKDPEFFRSVIAGYLANKKDKTFLDHWLLEADLASRAQPWEYSRLNTVERILLGRRVEGEAGRTLRSLTDLHSLMPPDVDRVSQLFDAAVLSGALAAEDEVGKKQADLLMGRIPPRSMSAQAGGLGGGGGLGGAAPGAPPQASREAVADAVRRSRLAEQRSAARPGIAAGRPESALRDRADAGADKAKDATLGKEMESNFFAEQTQGRLSYGALYRRVEPTQEWAENNYYKLRIQEQTGDLIGVNRFWLDFARQEAAQKFLSRHVAESTRNFSEMMFALALIDLPFEAPKHETKFDGASMTLNPAGPAIAYHEEITPTEAPTDPAPVLVSQNFYRHGERYKTENGENVDKFVEGEFLAQVVYGCQVVVTNPSSSRQKLSVLVQVPVGAIPVQDGRFTRTTLVDLEPYHTQTIDYLFYFPQPGNYAQFPVHVAKNEKTIAAAKPFAFSVVAKPSKIDAESWQYLSQNGTAEQVIAFLNRENVRALDLERIAFRMRDRAFFDAAIKLLSDRHLFQPTLWSYGIFHNAPEAARQFLMHADPIVAECGGPLDSPLLSIQPVARFHYEHLEYKPLVNARAHALGKRRQIVNDKLHEQYHRFLKQLSYRRAIDDADALATTYYLLLQDRIAEALEWFGRVDASKIASRLQYDYCAAWLQFFSDEPVRARPIAEKYAAHPVDRWRNAFEAILSQLDEIEGKPGKISDIEDRAQRQAELAAREPTFEFKATDRQLEIDWRNLSALTVNYYLMDVELLFSRNPFVQQSSDQFSSIRPNLTQTLTLPEGQQKMTSPMPDAMANRNVLIEMVAAGKTRSLAHYANAIDVRLFENYGQLQVTDRVSAKPAAKAYVKVYSRLATGEVKFHKDGYTDHRGRFDYASVSAPTPVPIQRFAILVLTEDKGAMIREVAPPAQ